MSTVASSAGGRIRVRRVFQFLALLLITISSAPAQQNLTLAWDPNSEPDITGYILYYGTATKTYSNSTNAGNVTNVTVANLLAGTTYFFAVTAFNTAGQESDFSIEISYTVPVPTNNPPSANSGYFASISTAGPAAIQLQHVDLPGAVGLLQSSTDLQRWTNILLFTNITGFQILTQQTLNTFNFYRVMRP